MTSWFNLLNQPLLERLGWTLVHSVWECAVVAVILAMLLAITRESRMRYLIACAALVMALLASLATFFVQQPTAPMAPMSLSVASASSSIPLPADIPVLDAASPVQPEAFSPRELLPWAAVVWLIGVILISIQHLGGWIAIRQLRRGAVPIEAEPFLTVMQRFSPRLGIRRAVVLAQSTLVNVPSVMGWFKPIILLPCSAMTELSPQYLEAILAHELAHVRRQDFLMNLIQTAIETLLFYHPAVWWISRQIRQEREHCCDDLAVSVIGDSKIYTESLMAMETLRNGLPDLALAAGGGSLLRRVRRLTRTEPARGSVVWPALILIGAILGAAIYFQANTAKVQAQGPATAPATQRLVQLVEVYPPPEEDPRSQSSDPMVVQKQAEMLQLEHTLRQLVRQRVQLQEQLRVIPAPTTRPETAVALQQQLDELTAQIDRTNRQLEAAQVILKQLRLPRAYFISGVVNSGRYGISHRAGEVPSATLGLAIQQGGGVEMAPGSAPKFAVITRQIPVDGQRSIVVSLRDVFLQPNAGGPAYGTRIFPGDVIMITDQSSLSLPPEGRYLVTGEVPQPGYYPWERGLTLLQALITAGVNPAEAVDRVAVITYVNPNNLPITYFIRDMIGGSGGAMNEIGRDATITVKPVPARDLTTRPAQPSSP